MSNSIRLGKNTARWLSFQDLADCIALWRRRRKSRRDLSRLDERLLRDIGLDRCTALEEVYKPFWRG